MEAGQVHIRKSPGVGMTRTLNISQCYCRRAKALKQTSTGTGYL
jgi:hypothetical protein